MNSRRVAIVVLLTLTALAGSIVPAAARTDGLGEPVPSLVENLPVPAQAVYANELRLTSQEVGGVAEGYRITRGVTWNALKQWYERELPKHQDFETWKWCESSSRKVVVQKTWARGDDILTVVLRKLPKDRGLVVYVGTEPTGPC